MVLLTAVLSSTFVRWFPRLQQYPKRYTQMLLGSWPFWQHFLSQLSFIFLIVFKQNIQLFPNSRKHPICEIYYYFSFIFVRNYYKFSERYFRIFLNILFHLFPEILVFKQTHFIIFQTLIFIYFSNFSGFYFSNYVFSFFQT